MTLTYASPTVDQLVPILDASLCAPSISYSVLTLATFVSVSAINLIVTNREMTLTFTSPVIDQVVSLIAVAVVPDGRVDASLCAPSVVFRALILATFVSWFVFEVGTVRLLIANF